MNTSDFMHAARELFETAGDEELGLTVELNYIAHVPGVGVAARVTMFVSDPWTYTGGELLLLRSEDWQRAEGLVRRRRAGAKSAEDGVWENAAATLEQLRGKLAELADSELAVGACAMPGAQYLGFEAVTEDFGPSSITDADRARRAAALEQSMARFDAAADKMMSVYGLRMPRHVAVFDAFMNSLSEIETSAMDMLGRRKGGIMIWFDEGGTERETRDGLDARLESRFRCDQPELVTIMWGDSDGLHFGLWYDDPAELPSFVAGNWARDSAETSKYERTALRTLLAGIDQMFEYGDVEFALSMGALRAALTDFMGADDAAVAADGEPKYANAEHPNLLGGIGCALPASAGDARAGWGESDKRYEAYREQRAEVDEWIAMARNELTSGKPAFAMTLGRELWWFDNDQYREVCTELLVDAYNALGRTKHAELIRLHHDHRDMGSVAVY